MLKGLTLAEELQLIVAIVGILVTLFGAFATLVLSGVATWIAWKAHALSERVRDDEAGRYARDLERQNLEDRVALAEQLREYIPAVGRAWSEQDAKSFQRFWQAGFVKIGQNARSRPSTVSGGLFLNRFKGFVEAMPPRSGALLRLISADIAVRTMEIDEWLSDPDAWWVKYGPVEVARIQKQYGLGPDNQPLP